MDILNLKGINVEDSVTDNVDQEKSVRLAIFKHIPAKAKTCTIQILMQPPTSFGHETFVSEELQASHFKLNNICQPIMSQDS